MNSISLREYIDGIRCLFARSIGMGVTVRYENMKEKGCFAFVVFSVLDPQGRGKVFELPLEFIMEAPRKVLIKGMEMTFITEEEKLVA